MQLATVLTCRKPEQGNRYGESPEGLPGSESVACSERSVMNLGGPSTSSALTAEVGRINRKKSARRVNQEKGVRSSHITLRR
jgi:hypothetical protein